MQAIILAAGMGKRLQKYTKNNTKCMVEVNGVTLIERLLSVLDKKQLSKVVIVVGYKGKELMDYIGTLNISTPIEFIDNPIYDKTNNIYSLALAGEYLTSEDTLLFESDIIMEESLIDCLIEDPRKNLALVDKYESWMDGTCMLVDENDDIVDFIPGKYINFDNMDDYYKTVNIYKFSKEFAANTYMPFLDAYRKSMGLNEYYESVIKLISMLDTKELKAKRLESGVWYEIDDVQDLDIAETLFTTDYSEKYDKIMSRYGGFWRYPKMLDFCYLVNPYFPSQKMRNEMRLNFDTLLENYPSGMRVNCLLASRNFNVDAEHIAVGNGAAELIKVLMETSDLGTLGLIRPTFEEYPNRYDKNKCVTFVPTTDDFSYTADDLMEYFSNNTINTLLLINPDNPSGNYIKHDDVLRLIEWAKSRSIQLIIDESFADFADECKTLITEDILSMYDGLYVMKSISKSYGVPGIRLGVLASHNEDMISSIKREVSIWNINSYGEFFMQIFEKYEKSYIASLSEIRKSRQNFFEQLKDIKYIRPIASQANYIMCEVTNGKSARKLAEYLLSKGILIKDLTKKVTNGKQYIRLAVRVEEQNDMLINALRMLED